MKPLITFTDAILEISDTATALQIRDAYKKWVNHGIHFEPLTKNCVQELP